MKKLIFICLLLCSCGWSNADYIREGAWMTLHGVDWAQTRQIAQHPEKYSESNPILGKHPSTQDVDLYMGIWMAAHPLITHLLPEDLRPYWQYISIGISGYAVISNIQAGIQF
jgi:hypothetical protein